MFKILSADSNKNVEIACFASNLVFEVYILKFSYLHCFHKWVGNRKIYMIPVPDSLILVRHGYLLFAQFPIDNKLMLKNLYWDIDFQLSSEVFHSNMYLLKYCRVVKQT